MKRKGRTSMDRCAQILEMRRAGHSINKIATALQMCKKTAKKFIEANAGFLDLQEGAKAREGCGLNRMLIT